MKPSVSTVASLGIGVPLATIFSWILAEFGVVTPGNVEAAMGAVIGAAAGYFFNGGKANDVAAR